MKTKKVKNNKVYYDPLQFPDFGGKADNIILESWQMFKGLVIKAGTTNSHKKKFLF